MIKREDELFFIKKAANIAAECMERVKECIKPGISTKYLEEVAVAFLERKGASPAFLGYKGYPASICTSVNHEVVHGIPGNRMLKEGDIVSVDIGVALEGFYADIAATFPVGRISAEAQRLIDITYKALWCGIEEAKPGAHLSDISYKIQSFVEGFGYSVVREFAGHGIGRRIHEEPQVPNFGSPGEGPILCPGMVLCIEPMVNIGTWRTRILEDGWTVVTMDDSLSAHFEHMVLVTENGPFVLTKI